MMLLQNEYRQQLDNLDKEISSLYAQLTSLKTLKKILKNILKNIENQYFRKRKRNTGEIKMPLVKGEHIDGI